MPALDLRQSSEPFEAEWLFVVLARRFFTYHCTYVPSATGDHTTAGGDVRCQISRPVPWKV
jgi:hypothetical protein